MTPDGMTLLTAAVHEGLHPERAIVDIVTADGETVQVDVSRRSIVEERIGIGWPVGQREDGAILLELPGEIISFGPHFGAWRIYVPVGSLASVNEASETEEGSDG